MIDVRVIANAVLDRADARGVAVTNLGMQKIVYFLHGHYLTRFHRPLVADEFEAWTYGPVHRTLYDAFRSYGDTPIEGRAAAFDPVRRQRRELPALDDRDAIWVLGQVLDYYLDIPTYLLVQIPHSKGTPWSLTVSAAESRPNVGMRISNELIARHFEGGASMAP
jgi:uncharacterized phage-associated protein